jgi:tyrosyl-DNA phosphodiesterase-1
MNTEIKESFGAHSESARQSVSSIPIHLIWPSVEDVRYSIEGWSAGGSLCCDQKNLKPFVRSLLHRWEGTFSG